MTQRCSETLVDLFESGARLNTDGVAVIYDDTREQQTMTYGQLVIAVHQVCKFRVTIYIIAATLNCFKTA